MPRTTKAQRWLTRRRAEMITIKTLAIAALSIAMLAPAKANAPIMEMMAAFTYAERCLPHDTEEYLRFRALTNAYVDSLPAQFRGMWAGAVGSWLSMSDACQLLKTTYEGIAKERK